VTENKRVVEKGAIQSPLSATANFSNKNAAICAVLLLFTNHHLFNIPLRFIIPEDRAVEKASPSRVTIRAALDAYLESLRIKKLPTKTITGKTYELGLLTGLCKKPYMDELVTSDLLGFRDYLRSEDYAERTVYDYLMTVTTFLKKTGVCGDKIKGTKWKLDILFEIFNPLYGPAEEVVRRRTVGVAAGLVVRQQITKGRRSSWRAAWRMRIRECGCAWDGSLLRGPARYNSTHLTSQTRTVDQWSGYRISEKSIIELTHDLLAVASCP
jgi:hypothetical protein